MHRRQERPRSARGWHAVMRFVRPLVAQAALLWVAACGGGGDGAGQPEITFAASLLPAEQAKYNTILDEFTRQTGIPVKLVAVQYAQIRSSVEAEAQAGRGKLDLVELDLPQLPVMRPLMQPLDGITSGIEALRDAVAEGAWEVTTAPGAGGAERTLYLPHRLNWQAMVYDSEKLPEPPGTWEELLAAARAHAGAIGLKCARYEGLICDVFPFIWQAGGDPLRPDSAEVVQAIEFLRELSAYFNPAVRSYQETPVLEAQRLGEIVLHFNWPFVVPLLREQKLLPSPMKVAPLPAGPAGRATVLGGGYLGIPAAAPHREQAARLMEFLTSVEGQRSLVRELGWFPMREEGWAAMSAADRELYAGYLAMRREVRARPAVADYDALSRRWQDAIYEILFEGADVKGRLKALQSEIEEPGAEG